MTFSTLASPGVSLQGGGGSGGGTPGGSNTQIQYNSSGTFAGASGLTTNGTELTIASGTKTADAPALNMSQTWNNGSTTFTGLKFNVADNASAAASLLMDLQVGPSSRFSVSKAGALRVTNGTAAAPAISSVGATNVGFNFSNQFTIDFVTGGTLQAQLRQGEPALVMGSSWAYSWASPASLTTVDLFLTRRGAANLRLGAADAAAPVAQTLSVQSVVAGTSDTAGANLTITGSQGTGTGAGGSIVFQVAPAGAVSNSVQNALATALTIDSTKLATFADGVKTAAPTGGTAATWKLGTRVAATTTLDTTQYIEVDVGGTLYKLAVVTS